MQVAQPIGLGSKSHSTQEMASIVKECATGSPAAEELDLPVGVKVLQALDHLDAHMVAGERRGHGGHGQVYGTT